MVRRGEVYYAIEVIPDYWLERPKFELTDDLIEHFEINYQKMLEGVFCLDDLGTPIWVFLVWLTENKPILLHGSANPNIVVFEPRTPDDRSPDAFSKQTAVFATSDGIWPIFYAIVDRQNFRLRMLNGAHQFWLEQGWSKMRYFFSITEPAFSQFPFREGTVYVLPKAGFKEQPLSRLANWRIREPQWASPQTLRPLAKVQVKPEDLPFLKQIRSHNEAEVELLSQKDPYGFPWL